VSACNAPQMARGQLRERRRYAYESRRETVEGLVPRAARRILDIGCASGAVGGTIKRRQPAEVVGIELSSDYARDAAQRLDHVICADVEDTLADLDRLGTFDCIIAADVLEHLVDPWRVLRRATQLLHPGGAVVVSLPNVQFLRTFWMLIRRGSWPREDSGLFDATHLRWFTRKDTIELVEQAGLTVTSITPEYWFTGWQLRVVVALSRTPLAPFLAGQYVVLGHKA
jgi:methionine biosynthesis protein MetW